MRSPRLLTISSGAVLTALTVLAAGCGGGSRSPGVATVGSSTPATTTTAQNGPVAFAQCMRSHGVHAFPGPDSTGAISKQVVVGIRAANPQKFDAAQAACSHLLPQSGLAPPETPQQIQTKVADGLSFARCMRSHGVANFPDPTAQGDLTVEMVQAQGIDIHSPAVLHAVQECLPASHGMLTPAKVAEALKSHPG